jgi:hypothetical protein
MKSTIALLALAFSFVGVGQASDRRRRKCALWGHISGLMHGGIRPVGTCRANKMCRRMLPPGRRALLVPCHRSTSGVTALAMEAVVQQGRPITTRHTAVQLDFINGLTRGAIPHVLLTEGQRPLPRKNTYD